MSSGEIVTLSTQVPTKIANARKCKVKAKRLLLLISVSIAVRTGPKDRKATLLAGTFSSHNVPTESWRAVQTL